MEQTDNFFRYRIGVINDFRNQISVLDYQEWQKDIWQLDAWETSGPRTKQSSEHCIYVFLNFKLIGKFKTNDQAQGCINDLLKKGPPRLLDHLNYLSLSKRG